MVLAAPKRWSNTGSYTSVTSESLGVPQTTYSIDSELLTSDEILVQSLPRQKTVTDKRKLWYQGPESTGEYTLEAGQVIAFPGLGNPTGITEGDFEEEFTAGEEYHYRELLVKVKRETLFSKEVSLDPKTMRRLQPKIVLDERYFTGDDE